MRRQKVEKEAVGGRGRWMNQQKGEAVGGNSHKVKAAGDGIKSRRQGKKDLMRPSRG